MQINVQLLRLVVALVPLFVENARSFPMSLAHEIVLALASQAERFGGARVAAVPSLRGAATESASMIYSEIDLDIPLQELVPQTAMLESLRTSLEVRLIPLLARLEPRDVLWRRDRLSSSTVLAGSSKALSSLESFARGDR